MPAVSTDSDDSAISDDEEPEIPVSEDLDYQNSVPLPIQPAISRSPTTFELYGLTLPQLPTRSSHWSCDTAWHYDTARSPINGDGEESNNSDSDDSEESTIRESSSFRKAKGKREKKAPGNSKNQEAFKKEKTATMLNKTQKVEVEEGANLHALRRRSPGPQPAPVFQMHPLEVQRRVYSTFTLQQVQNGCII